MPGEEKVLRIPSLMSKVDGESTLWSKSPKNAQNPFIPNDDLYGSENTINAWVYIFEAAVTRASLREDGLTKKNEEFSNDRPFST